MDKNENMFLGFFLFFLNYPHNMNITDKFSAMVGEPWILQTNLKKNAYTLSAKKYNPIG